MARSPAESRSPAGRWPLLAAALVAAGLVAGCNAFPNPPPPRGFDGPTQVTVQPGEDLQTVARRWNVPVEEVARMNGLQPPYSVAPGTVLTLPRPRLHVVQEADSLLTISQQYGVDVAALARANNIAEPYAIYVGETLRLPSGSDMAVAGMTEGPGSAGPSTGPRAIAGPGSTSRGAPLSAAVESAPLNELPTQSSTPPAALATGPETSSAIALPGDRAAPAPGAAPSEGTLGTLPAPRPGAEGQTDRDAAAARAGTTAAAAAGLETLPRPPARGPVPSTRSAPAAAAETDAPTVTEAPTAPESTAPASTAPASTTPSSAETAPAAQPAAAPAAPESPPATGPRFRWPVAGDVVSGFGPKADGSRNDGINVAAPRGTPVVAAQNGVVAYVGDEIESFGNLVLLRHADGWVTAYAHVDRVLVAADERVSIGQTIATVGTTGNVATPQLHFEIRRGTEPLDPSVYLTAR